MHIVRLSNKPTPLPPSFQALSPLYFPSTYSHLHPLTQTSSPTSPARPPPASYSPNTPHFPSPVPSTPPPPPALHPTGPTSYPKCQYLLPYKIPQLAPIHSPPNVNKFFTVARTLPSSPSSMKRSGRNWPRSLKIRGMLCIGLLAIASVECGEMI